MNDKSSLSHFDYYLISTIIAIILAVPGLTTLLILRNLKYSVEYQIVACSIMFFVSLAFSFKVAEYLSMKFTSAKN